MVAAIPNGCEYLLDVAGGKGDIAMRFLRGSKSRQAVVLDPSFEMLSKASEDNKANKTSKASESNKSNNPNSVRVLAPAEALPFASNSFDAVTMAFGIRNITHRQKALNEAQRVLKPYGKFICLELGKPKIFPHLHRLYLKRALPMMAKVLKADVGAYEYLADSILTFPTPAQVCLMLQKAGFDGVRHRSFHGGIASIFSGFKSEKTPNV